MKKLVLCLSVLVLFISHLPQAQACFGKWFCCCCCSSDDGPPSHPRVKKDSDSGTPLLDKRSSRASSHGSSSFRYKLKGLDITVTIPTTFEVQNRPMGILGISSSSPGVLFLLYPNYDSLAQTSQYLVIQRSSETLIKDSVDFSDRVEEFYEAIRDLGRGKDQLDPFEEFVTLIQLVVEKFPFSDKGNSYRLGETADQKFWRMYLQTKKGQIVTIHVNAQQ